MYYIFIVKDLQRIFMCYNFPFIFTQFIGNISNPNATFSNSLDCILYNKSDS